MGNKKDFIEEFDEFEILDFSEFKKVGKKNYPRDIVSYSQNENSASISVNTYLSEELKDYSMFYMGRSPKTGSYYLIFNDEKGLNTNIKNKGRVRVQSVHLKEYMKDVFAVGKKDYVSGHFRISDNISEYGDRKIYKILEVVDKFTEKKK